MTAIDATMREFNGDTDRLYFLSHLETAIKVANDKEILKWLLAQRRKGGTN